MFRFARPLVLASTVAFGLFILSATHAHAVTTYYACVNNSSGAIDIVSATHVCEAGQHKISWNETGPPGPKGDTGPRGACRT